MKRRLGLLPPVAHESLTPQDLTGAEDLYAVEIAPVLKELGAISADEVLRRMASEPDFPLEYVKFPDHYLMYVEKLVDRIDNGSSDG